MCGLGGVLIAVGFGMQFCAWLFYRHPGVEFYVFFVPPWQLAHYLRRDGVHLMLSGLVAFAIGSLIFIFNC
jgi:hypothetical protein